MKHLFSITVLIVSCLRSMAYTSYCLHVNNSTTNNIYMGIDGNGIHFPPGCYDMFMTPEFCSVFNAANTASPTVYLADGTSIVNIDSVISDCNLFFSKDGYAQGIFEPSSIGSSSVFSDVDTNAIGSGMILGCFLLGFGWKLRLAYRINDV